MRFFVQTPLTAYVARLAMTGDGWHCIGTAYLLFAQGRVIGRAERCQAIDRAHTRCLIPGIDSAIVVRE
jgi:hypothetical protein